MSSPVLVIIPAKNEERSVGQVVARLRAEHGHDILVVDDDSSDGTAGAAREAGARVCSLPIGLGAWGAMQAGIRFALVRGYACVVTMDADGQHLAEHLPDLLGPVQSGEADVVIGACTKRGSGLRRLAWSWYRLAGGLDIRDLTSGFRAYNVAAMSLLAKPAATLLDYQDMGVLLLLVKAGIRIREVEVEMCCRLDGHSRIFDTWGTVAKYMLLNSILCLSRRLNPAARNGTVHPGQGA